jgi:phosphatidylserine/phosphatidylglycerophosphate/cardiolipin synthase-like enzyme
MKVLKYTHNFPLVILILAFCLVLSGCNVNIGTTGSPSNSPTCQGNCSTGNGVQGVQVYVEPDAGEHVITDAIHSAHKSVWLEIYLLSDRNVIRALEDAANNGVDVRVMLELHPVGGGTSPQRTIDQLKAAGIQAQATSPDFPLTHEKGMIIDGTTAYIMTSNFTRSALGGYSGSSGSTNREYGIIDTNPQDVQAVAAIFQADWNRTQPQFNDPNLVVSPINSRNAFLSLINSAHSSLLIEAEEMQDSEIEQAIISAAHRGVHVEVILPSSNGSSDSNSEGISILQSGGVQVREDTRLYMHAKIIIVDGSKAFVGSENISTQSLDQNRELGIIVSDSNVLNRLQSTFQMDWGDSQGA